MAVGVCLCGIIHAGYLVYNRLFDLLFDTSGCNSFVMTDLEQSGAPAFTNHSAQDTSLAAQEAQAWIEVRQASLTSASGFIVVLTNRRL